MIEKVDNKYSESEMEYLKMLPRDEQFRQTISGRVGKIESKLNKIIDHLNGKEKQGFNQLTKFQIERILEVFKTMQDQRIDKSEDYDIIHKLTLMKGKA